MDYLPRADVFDAVRSEPLSPRRFAIAAEWGVIALR